MTGGAAAVGAAAVGAMVGGATAGGATAGAIAGGATAGGATAGAIAGGSIAGGAMMGVRTDPTFGGVFVIDGARSEVGGTEGVISGTAVGCATAGELNGAGGAVRCARVGGVTTGARGAVGCATAGGLFSGARGVVGRAGELGTPGAAGCARAGGAIAGTRTVDGATMVVFVDGAAWGALGTSNDAPVRGRSGRAIDRLGIGSERSGIFVVNPGKGARAGVVVDGPDLTALVGSSNRVPLLAGRASLDRWGLRPNRLDAEGGSMARGISGGREMGKLDFAGLFAVAGWVEVDGSAGTLGAASGGALIEVVGMLSAVLLSTM